MKMELFRPFIYDIIKPVTKIVFWAKDKSKFVIFMISN